LANKNFCSNACSGAAKMVNGAKWRDPTKIKDYMRQYNSTNKQRLNAQKQAWKKSNRHIVNAIQRARRAGAKYGDFLPHEWEEIKRRYGFECLACGRSEPEIKLEPDHIQALSKGGAHKADNIQPLCRSCNARKGTKNVDYRPYKEAAA
jgi:5-methylcytosine-specific restriction endonuclease McrA